MLVFGLWEEAGAHGDKPHVGGKHVNFPQKSTKLLL